MEMERKFRTGLVQVPVKLGDRVANMETIRGWMKEYYTRSGLTTAMVLPELWDIGYALDSIPCLADHQGEEAMEFLGALAKEYNCWFTAGSIAAEDAGKYYNRTLIINPKGELVDYYDKAHLVPFITVEDGVFEAGDRPCLFDMDGIWAGSVICYDIRFPEWVRIYALRGVEVLFICSQWTRARMELLKIMVRARSIENTFYSVAINNCGLSGEIDFGGGSLVSSPTGEVLAECSGDMDGKFADIDVADIDETRKLLKVLEKRRPHLYSELVL